MAARRLVIARCARQGVMSRERRQGPERGLFMAGKRKGLRSKMSQQAQVLILLSIPVGAFLLTLLAFTFVQMRVSKRKRAERILQTKEGKSDNEGGCMLRTIDLMEVSEFQGSVMSRDEWSRELAKPRAERRGLSSMPADMSCTGADAVRMSESIARVASANAAARARGMANARFSATSR